VLRRLCGRKGQELVLWRVCGRKGQELTGER